jgi:hypothetical protein
MYLPSRVRDVDPIVPEGTDLAIYTWEERGKYLGIAFAGRANKPLWNYIFNTEARRDAQIKETTEARLEGIARMKERMEAKKTWRHKYQVGDILYSSWGYDQTNVDFYEVTAVQDKSIVIREISSKLVGDDRVVALPGRFEGAPMRKIPQGRGDDVGSVKLNSFSYAHKWDGKPKYVTPSGYGH